MNNTVGRPALLLILSMLFIPTEKIAMYRALQLQDPAMTKAILTKKPSLVSEKLSATQAKLAHLMKQERLNKLSDIEEPQAHESIAHENAPCNNLILIFDITKEETIETNIPAMVYKLAKAIEQKSAPIIVSNNTMEVWCTRQKDPNNEQYYMKLFEPNQPEITLTNDDWHCYTHKTAGLMLLIPKSYIAQRISEKVTDINERAHACGFSTKNLNKINDLSFLGILEHLQAHQITYDNIIEAIDEIFSDRPLGQWNIYLTGHGSIPIRTIEKESPTPQDVKISNYDRIAGLNYNNFFKLLDFFNTRIHTSFLYYSSCYSGGFKQAIIREILSQMNANFIVVAKGLNETETTDRMLLVKFTEFFSLLESFFSNQKNISSNILHSKDPIAKIVSSVTDEKDILNNQPFVYIPAIGIFNALSVDKQVKILTNSISRAHELEGSTIDFTDPNIKAVLIYPSYIAAPIKINLWTAIVAPTIQELSSHGERNIHIFEEVIRYNSNMAFTIFDFAQRNSNYGTTIFVLKKLELNSSDRQQQVVYNNVIICIQGSWKNNGIQTDINVLFNNNNKHWATESPIQIHNITQNFNLFVENIQNHKYFEILPAKLQYFSKILLNQWGMKELDDMNTGIPFIISELEKEISGKKVPAGSRISIEENTRVEEPGSLKNILLKKLNIISIEKKIRQIRKKYDSRCINCRKSKTNQKSA